MIRFDFIKAKMRTGRLDTAALSGIKAIVMDVDGILTDCKIWMDASGEWRRAFSVRDGIGIKRVVRAGYPVGWITGSKSQDIQARAKMLGVGFLSDGQEDKQSAFADFCARHGCEPREVAYIGDDLPDVALLEQAGFSATVPSAVPEVLNAVDFVTTYEGGLGAARELCDLIFKFGSYSAGASPQEKK